MIRVGIYYSSMPVPLGYHNPKCYCFKDVSEERLTAFTVRVFRALEAVKGFIGNKSSYDLILPTVLKGLVLPAQVKADDMKIRRIDQGVGSTSGIRACALRYFDLGNMELENSQNNSLAKLPILKLGEYEMWEIRIKQYFQIQDYALWEVIEYGNSWVPIPITAPESGPSTALKMTVPSTTEEKICKKNDVKARSLLLMALPNEHQLTFNQYADAQSMFIAIKARFGGNDATKKTQKALLKQQYENFNATSSESLDSIFNRLQKLVSRLAILGVDTSPEDLNVKFLRSLPSEWDTHVVVWMNKPDFETMGLDDLYNNFKIVEQKVKRTVAVNNDDKNLAFLTTTSPSSTNSINTANTGVSTGNSKVNTASAETSTASFSDATAYAFLSSQPQGSQLVHEDLEQIHDDDLEEMDLKWNMALLSMRARKFYQRTGRKIVIDGSSTAGYDKSKILLENVRVPRSKDNRSGNQGELLKTSKYQLNEKDLWIVVWSEGTCLGKTFVPPLQIFSEKLYGGFVYFSGEGKNGDMNHVEYAKKVLSVATRSSQKDSSLSFHAILEGCLHTLERYSTPQSVDDGTITSTDNVLLSSQVVTGEVGELSTADYEVNTSSVPNKKDDNLLIRN
ncbi:hypothetical protein Tco_0058685 [Tanacetum coccineum]